MNPEDQSDVIMHVCTYFPQIQGEMAARRRVALSATFAYKRGCLTLPEWRKTILAGHLEADLADSVNELLAQED